MLRSYSLSGQPSGERWRVSVEREPDGAAGAYSRMGSVGGVIDRARRAALYAEGRRRAGVLLSAGIGLTPVLAMLHALAAAGSRRAFGGFTARATRRASVDGGSAGAS